MEIAGMTLASVPTMHHSVGGAVFSAAINMAMLGGFSLVTYWTLWDHEEEGGAYEVLSLPAKYPFPSYLSESFGRTVNLGFAGVAGAGKSSIVNALRKVMPSDPQAAPVGINDMTLDPSDCTFDLELDDLAKADGHSTVSVRLWDLPGAGTSQYSTGDYVRDLGLRYFDAVFIVYADRASDVIKHLATELSTFNVPLYMIRSQVDADISNEAQDNERSEREVLQRLREEAELQGLPSTFLISSRQPTKYDFPQLLSVILTRARARDSINHPKDCPVCVELFDSEDRSHRICHWCRNAICEMCAHNLQGRLAEAPCPFCRRWTSFLEKD